MSPSQRSSSDPFPATRWTVVLAACDTDPEAARDAWTELARMYWYPLYVFARSKGLKEHDAQDLIQGFFEHLFERNVFARATADAGRLRAFLLASLKNYLSQERRRATTLKRGGGLQIVSADAEARYVAMVTDDHVPLDKLFDRQWAETVLGHVLERLREDFAQHHRLDQFEAFQGFLVSSEDSPTYGQLAERFGMKESAVRVSVHRARRKYAELLRSAIAETLSPEDSLEDELNYLMSLFS